MASNIELIKILRERTGAGIMDCKNALAANGDDLDKATDWLREKGIAKQAKKADRIAAEGLVLIKKCEECHRASIVEVNCETDFVSKGDAFRGLVQTCAEKVLKNSAKTLEEAKELINEEFTDAAVKLGEKLDFRRFEIVEALDGQELDTYIHMGGKIGVIVVLEKADHELAHSLAMCIAANNPKYITVDDIPGTAIEDEKKLQLAASKNDPKLANKPEQVLVKIIEGKVMKTFAPLVLCEQEYLMDPSKTVGQVLKEKNNKVVKFVRYEVGEGIAKRVDNFAEEVAKQAAGL